MARMIYSSNVSLDGFTEDKDGKIDWTDPGDDVFAFVTNIIRTTGTHLYGRRMYETMLLWETDPNLAAASPLMRTFAEIWQSADKIVFSTTLKAAPTRKTQLRNTFDAEAIRQLKAESEHDLLIGGPNLAAQAFRAGLIDECHLYLAPVILGGGKPFFPRGVRLELELLQEHRFGNGTVFLRYGNR